MASWTSSTGFNAWTDWKSRTNRTEASPMEDQHPMLTAATNKMTGLDLGPPQGSGSGPTHLQSPRTLKDLKSKPWSPSPQDDLLQTPVSAGLPLLTPSPRLRKLSPSPVDAKGGEAGCNHYKDTAEDVLTTPVIMAPRSADAWSQSKAEEFLQQQRDAPHSHLPLGMTSISLREESRDLPMDSDIGLRSPCDSVLIRRRHDRMRKASSLNSDTNSNHSCDTPSACENSPRDLSTSYGAKPAQPLAENPKQLLPPPPSTVSKSPTTLKAKLLMSSYSEPPHEDEGKKPEIWRVTPPPTTKAGNFRHPTANKPENLKFTGEQMPLPNHYTPSPLTVVPSPNWTAVSQNFGVDMWKTPKILDNTSVFDFLPPPNTPRGRGAGGLRDHSPGNELSDYQRLSPRLSPRFLIPEAPTDLSNGAKGGCLAGKGGANDSLFPEEIAQDLSISKPSSHSAVKQEKMDTTNHHHHHHHLQPPPPSTVAPSIQVKTEEVGNDTTPQQQQQQQQFYAAAVRHQQAAAAMASFPTNLYLQGIHSFYNRQMYGVQHTQDGVQRTTPPTSSSPSASNLLPHHYRPQQPYGGGPWSGNPSPSQAPSWSSHQDDEQSMSPPHSFGGRMPSPSAPGFLHREEGPDYPAAEGSQGKKRGRKPVGASTPSGTEPKRSCARKSKKGEKSVDGGSGKRTYSCPHCQRTYDWNYNLNRHLKYECGKENAFQCSKCGRRFPHKQNCVYHLKRKHKIVCESIDQYMSAGLVVFHGNSSQQQQNEMGTKQEVPA